MNKRVSFSHNKHPVIKNNDCLFWQSGLRCYHHQTRGMNDDSHSSVCLYIWIYLTKSVMRFGRYFFKRCRPDNPRAERWGAFWGFMLAMGWVFMFWAMEAVQARQYAVEMCSQAGFKTYVTPEQWKQMVGGEEAWRNLTLNDPYRNQNSFDHSQHIVFNGKKYESQMHWNERVLTFTKDKAMPYAMMTDRVYFDTVTKTVLFQEVLVSTGPSPSEFDWRIAAVVLLYPAAMQNRRAGTVRYV